jgi:hypothetical protein
MLPTGAAAAGDDVVNGGWYRVDIRTMRWELLQNLTMRYDSIGPLCFVSVCFVSVVRV